MQSLQILILFVKMGKFVNSGVVCILLHLMNSKHRVSFDDSSVVHLLSIFLSVSIGFVVGKVYMRAKSEPYIQNRSAAHDDIQKIACDDGDIQSNSEKYILNGTYAKNFLEIKRCRNEFYKVEHILEKRRYYIKKIRFFAFKLEELFQIVHQRSRISAYVTSWLEWEKESEEYVLFIQYENNLMLC